MDKSSEAKILFLFLSDIRSRLTFAIPIRDEKIMGAIHGVVGGPWEVQANPKRPMISKGPVNKSHKRRDSGVMRSGWILAFCLWYSIGKTKETKLKNYPLSICWKRGIQIYIRELQKGPRHMKLPNWTVSHGRNAVAIKGASNPHCA